jgi:hypothetical protein
MSICKQPQRRPQHAAAAPQPAATLAAAGLDPLYVIILNWNLADETIACVESVQASTAEPVHILVVDNGSTDDSLARLRARFGQSIALLPLADNLGFAGGVNAGIQAALAAGAAAVLLLNNDTVIDPTMIAQLAAVQRQQPQAALLAPVIYYHAAPQHIWRLADREYRWLPLPLALGARALERAGAEPLRVDYVTACGVLVRRAVFEQIGLFDTSYFMYFEDADFCRRARNAGFQIWCVPLARMWHKVSLSARKDKPGSRYAMAWGRARFYRHHPHGPLPGLTFLYLWLRALRTSCLDLLCGDGVLIRPLWQGTLDGYALRPSRRQQFATPEQ